MGSADAALAGKYHKLLSEFSKVKGQLLLLSKALSEEQRNSQALREQLDEKECLLRQVREADSLICRAPPLQHAPQQLPVDQLAHSAVLHTLDTDDAVGVSALHDGVQQLALESESLYEANQHLRQQSAQLEVTVKEQEHLIRQQKLLLSQLSCATEHPAAGLPLV